MPKKQPHTLYIIKSSRCEQTSAYWHLSGPIKTVLFTPISVWIATSENKLITININNFNNNNKLESYKNIQYINTLYRIHTIL